MISRRKFAHLAGVAAASMALGALAGCDSGEEGAREGTHAARERDPGEAPPSAASQPNPLQAGWACVAEYAGNTLAVVDLAEGTVVERLPVGQNPASLAWGAGTVFVGSSGGGELWMVPRADATQARAVAAGNQPLGLCFDAARGRVYAADYFLGCIHVIDAALGSVVGVMGLSPVGFHNRTDPPECCRIEPGAGRRPVSLALSPEGDLLYCANYGTYDVARIDLATGAEREAFDGVVGPRTVLVAQGGAHLLLAGVGGEEEQRVECLYVVDRQSGQRVREVPVGSGVAGVCQTPDGKAVLALSRNEGVLVALDAVTWEERGRCTLSLGTDSLALAPDGSHACVANSATGVLAVVNAETLEVEQRIGGLAGPKDVLVVPD